MSLICSKTDVKVEVESDLLRIKRGSWIEQKGNRKDRKENETAQRSNLTRDTKKLN